MARVVLIVFDSVDISNAAFAKAISESLEFRIICIFKEFRSRIDSGF